ncbi:MAG: hypothetical protein JST87_01555 [Bacteroidetes bacterium]|nr:hypothetical protein [Bacteroidota bacterium]
MSHIHYNDYRSDSSSELTDMPMSLNYVANVHSLEDLKNPIINHFPTIKFQSSDIILFSEEVEKQAEKILSSLDEAKKIHKGQKKGKTFDDFLKEI